MSNETPDRRSARTGANSPALRFSGHIIVTGAVLGLTITALSLFVLPRHWGANSVHEPQLQPGETLTVGNRVDLNNDRSQAEDRVRNTGLKIAAGIAAIAAALVAWGRIELSRAEHQLAQDDQRVTRDAQFTDRYTKAVEQLGNDHTEVRLGGLYALERLAHDSEDDRHTIFEVISAYVRYRSRPVPQPKNQAELSDHGESPDQPTASRHPEEDVQAGLTILGRRRWRQDEADVNYQGADLGATNLPGADLQGADLQFANFQGADLHGADLQGADLRGANLHGANLMDVNFQGADLQLADLQLADLQGARLQGARNLNEAGLRGARNLNEADLPDHVESDPDQA